MLSMKAESLEYVVSLLSEARSLSIWLERVEFPGGGGMGGTSRKIVWGCAACFPKPLPYL